VVEQAPALRAGGQAVDFKGETHRQVLERMGILEDVRRLETGKTDLVIVDEHDRRLRVPLRRLHQRADPDRVERRRGRWRGWSG
jgi:2-polyprenyl-6-methoxyphenol hydroxylase-like FAD-dependent oxidoreductase